MACRYTSLLVPLITWCFVSFARRLALCSHLRPSVGFLYCRVLGMTNGLVRSWSDTKWCSRLDFYIGQHIHIMDFTSFSLRIKVAG